MVTRRETEPEPDPRPHRAATTPEGREKQLVNLAVELAEKQMRAGTASAQVISYYLKLGSTREKLEQARLEAENELLKAKVEALQSAKNMEQLVQDAINAMREYTGNGGDQYDEEFED